MRADTAEDYRQRMLRVLVHIQQHLDDDLALERLAALACFSPYHFHRVFRGMVGEPLAAHVRRLRLERAAMRLRSGDGAVIAVALEAGYESHAAFSRAFRSAFGASPSAFRRRHSHQAGARARSGVHYRSDGSAPEFNPWTAEESDMDVRTEQLEPQRVAFVRHVGPYAECGAAWEALCARLGPAGLLGPDTRMVGLCHDDPEVTPPEKIRYDACATIADDADVPEGVAVQTIAGGPYAVAVHEGPYENLSGTYAHVCGQWAPRSGQQLRAAPCFEVYLNDVHRTPPGELRTEVHVPLEA